MLMLGHHTQARPNYVRRTPPVVGLYMRPRPFSQTWFHENEVGRQIPNPDILG